MSVVVCGAGTLGGHLVEHLVRMGCADLVVVDRDNVEAANLGNQPYALADVGRPKAKALSAALFQALGARVRGVRETLRASNADRLLDGAALVVDAFDNHDARQAVQDACRRGRIPCLHLGLSADGYGEVRWDEGYAVPPDAPDDACERRRYRLLAVMVATLAAAAVTAFQERGERPAFTVTAADMGVDFLQASGDAGAN